MEFLQGYGSGDEEDVNKQPLKKIKINAAPAILDIVSTQDKSIYSLFQPYQEPIAKKNCWTGHVSSLNMNEASFDEQYHKHQNLLVPADPRFKSQNKKRKAVDESTGQYVGPWARYEEIGFEILEGNNNNNNNNNSDNIIINEEKENKTKKNDKKEKENKEKDKDKVRERERDEFAEEGDDGKETAKAPTEEKSIFHGKELRDYLGRSYLTPPSDLKSVSYGELRDFGRTYLTDTGELKTSSHGALDCFLPKKKIHTWTGHTKGISCTRFFPRFGHLILSASHDGKVKLWDVYNQRRVLRTFIGHEKGVKDVCWSNDGTKFLSASFDRYIKLWDSETGQCISRFTNGKIPFCVKLNPDDDKQHSFLAGSSDKKIIQWDTRTNEIVQEYDRHLGPVNSITFVDENRRFVTTSDDKSIRVWEWNIPVDIKYISEPHMHSMPSVALSPNQKWLACQSLDNQILIYSVDRFKLNKKKRFRGHLVAGYACQVSFSPDGKYLLSGDSEGFFCVWDWKSQKMYKKLKAHDSVCIGVEWHPIEASRVATCGWDGKIHYWD